MKLEGERLVPSRKVQGGSFRNPKPGHSRPSRPTVRAEAAKACGRGGAGATVPISIITADDAKARIAHHQRELEKAWRDYYGPAADVRTHDDKRGVLDEDHRQATSVFMICAGGSHTAPIG
jgi:hypothetical protein